MINPETGEPLIDFPTYFTYKIIGNNDDLFETIILDLLHQTVPPIREDHIKRSYSRTQKYITLTIQVYVVKQEEINQIYSHLKAEKSVLWAL